MRSTALFIAALSAIQIHSCSASLSTILESGSEECFVIRAPPNEPAVISYVLCCLLWLLMLPLNHVVVTSPICMFHCCSFYSGNYDCLDDELSADPISVKLKDEKGRLLWKSTHGESEQIFELHVDNGGRFTFCLSNKGDKEDLDRRVGFALRVRAPSRALADMIQGPDGEKAFELIEWAEDLTEEWDTLLDHYDYLRDREAAQEELSDKIFKRVMKWTIAEAILLITIASAQVLYFRKFFEKRRYL